MKVIGAAGNGTLSLNYHCLASAYSNPRLEGRATAYLLLPRLKVAIATSTLTKCTQKIGLHPGLHITFSQQVNAQRKAPLKAGCRRSTGERRHDLQCGRTAVSASINATRNERAAEKRHVRVLVSTGDIMGDVHAANLVRALFKEAEESDMQIDIFALGGKHVAGAGAKLIGDNTGLSSIGLAEALPLVFPSLKLQAKIRAFLKDNPPDVVVLIDYPGVNIPFGRYLKEIYGSKVVYYIPPNEWLWNTSRTAAIVRMSDSILAVYPREAEYYAGEGGKVEQVGHPLLDLVPNIRPSKEEAKRLLGLPNNATVVALFPASREQELRHVWPVMAEAARKLQDAAEFRDFGRWGKFDMRFVIPVVSKEHLPALKEGLQKHGLSEQTIIWQGDSHMVMAAADLAITKTGSVNVELALFDVPQVAVYKLDAFTAWLAQAVFKFNVPHISLVNLILDQQLIPEFVQDKATAEAIADAALSLLPSTPGERQQKVLEGYQELRSMLGSPGVTNRAAAIVLSLARSKPSKSST